MLTPAAAHVFSLAELRTRAEETLEAAREEHHGTEEWLDAWATHQHVLDQLEDLEEIHQAATVTTPATRPEETP